MTTRRKLRGLASGLALALALTAGAASPSAAVAALLTKADGVIRHDIAVTTVDPTAVQAPNRRTGKPNENFVLAPQAPAARKKKLFLYIVGSGVSETTAQEILYEGARRGYNAIAIAYRNYEAVVPLCAKSADDDCTGKVREEILTGVDMTPLVTIGPQDALEPRLQKLLVYLRATYPAEGWGEFLNGGETNWAKVTVAGHSQGAGHVALLVKRHAMERAVMISGVADREPSGKPAPWLFRPNKTPVDRVFGFSNVADTVVTFPIAEASWKAMGLKGPPTSVDGRKPDFGGSHMLSTATNPTSGSNHHTVMVDDNILPRNPDGSPVYLPVWDFLIFP
jgi:pimeloyl-ACP methyl ester carboxylesterase